MISPIELYEHALTDSARREDLRVRYADGSCAPLPVRRYAAGADDLDTAILSDLEGPVLDVGCGPGRHLAALLSRGVYAFGVDLSPVAVACVRRRGAYATVADVFGPVPGEGRWASALLLDGNIGIGGDPQALLERVGTLLVPGGVALVELEAPGTDTRPRQARLESAQDASRWFSWGRVCVGELAGLAEATGLAVERVWECDGRWFAHLRSSLAG